MPVPVLSGFVEDIQTVRPAPYWTDMSAAQLAEADTRGWIGVLPVAATEQHGPHLPASTDADIARAMVAATVEQLPHELPATFLPVEEVGWSAEHGDTPGTVSGDPVQLAAKWLGSHRGPQSSKGLRKAVIVSSHGGNTPVADTVIMRARAELGMLCVATSVDAVRLSAGAVQRR
jgi:creatinine amidohydrolase